MKANFKQSRPTTYSELNELPSPQPMGRFHRPLRFDELVNIMEDVFNPPNPVELAINPSNTKLFGLMRFDDGNKDFQKTLAFCSSTDESRALKIAAGAHVWACENGILSGDMFVMRKLHTTKLNLATELFKALGRITDRHMTFEANLNQLKEAPLSYADGCTIICNALQLGYFPSTDAKKVIDIWRDPTTPESNGSTAWTLLNAFTRVAKEHPVMARFDRTVNLGKLFGI